MQRTFTTRSARHDISGFPTHGNNPFLSPVRIPIEPFPLFPRHDTLPIPAYPSLEPQQNLFDHSGRLLDETFTRRTVSFGAPPGTTQVTQPEILGFAVDVGARGATQQTSTVHHFWGSPTAGGRTYSPRIRNLFVASGVDSQIFTCHSSNLLIVVV